MRESGRSLSQRIADAACDLEHKRTGLTPESVHVVHGDGTLVITLRGALSPAEMALARNAEGAARVQEYYRQLFASNAHSLRDEIKRITGIEVREAMAEVEPSTGAMITAFATGRASAPSGQQYPGQLVGREGFGVIVELGETWAFGNTGVRVSPPNPGSSAEQHPGGSDAGDVSMSENQLFEPSRVSPLLEPSPLAPRAYGVLVADDERETRNALEWGLQREGFSVWLASDGQEAVEQYRECHASIDVLLLAVDLPKLDGPTALAMLQALNAEIVCCFMSGDLTSDALQRLHDRGLSAIVAKPINIPQLADRIRTLARAAEMSRGRARNRAAQIKRLENDPAFASMGK